MKELKVSCMDRDKLEKTSAYFDVEIGDNLFEVYCIATHKNHKEYLLRSSDETLMWFESAKFEVIDNSIPPYWIYRKYGYFSNLRNKKYDFDIRLNEYWGPEEFLNNEDFFFDIYEDREKANSYLKEIMKKYNNTNKNNNDSRPHGT